jgi:hypothetical protein
MIRFVVSTSYLGHVMDLFSRRQRPPADKFDSTIPDKVRKRIVYSIQKEFGQSFGGSLEELVSLLLTQGGEVKRGPGQSHPALEHIAACSNEEFLDVLELLFHTTYCCGGQPTVELINQILAEENIGFELTSFVYPPQPPLSGGKPRSSSILAPPSPGTQFPKVILKSEKMIHAETIEPALRLLADPRFATANSEFVAGLVHLRHGKYDDAIPSCGSAVESVLKTICTLKKWPYDKDKHTLSDLLTICGQQGLYPPFYQTVLATTGMIRNKVGKGHGRGPTVDHPATKELADHMVHTRCSNILLLVSLAKL